jgi:hypothetical protein
MNSFEIEFIKEFQIMKGSSKDHMKDVVKILLASHIYLLLMKSFNTCSSIGCSSYKFVSTIYVILANTIMVSNSTLGDLSNYKSTLIQSYFDTNITLFPYWKDSVPKVIWLSILNPSSPKFAAHPINPSQIVPGIGGIPLFFVPSIIA